MSEERFHRMNEWTDGWMDNLSSKRQGHDISKERGLLQLAAVGSSKQ
jgi:hypothetical protein